MTRLNQIVAVVSGVKEKTHQKITELHKKNQKKELFSGMTRKYKPDDENGEPQAPENKPVLVRTNEVLKEAEELWTNLLDTVLTLDHNNTLAKATIKINNKEVKDVPITYLVFLEKQLNDLRTFVDTIPELDPSFNWHFDEATNLFKTDESIQYRSKKVPRNHIKAEATDKHPAQVEVYHEDVKVGSYSRFDFSGAIPATRKQEILKRIQELQTAVVFAREEANSIEIQKRNIAKDVFDFVFGRNT